MKRRLFDPWLVIPVIILSLFSIVVLRSVLPQESGRQLIFLSFSLLGFFIFLRIDYKLLAQFSKMLYVLAILLLSLTFVFGRATRGSIRWLEIGPLTIQPSELIKPVMILFLANLTAEKDIKIFKNFAFFLITALLPVALVFIQPDLGSSMVLIFIGISIAFSAGVPMRILGMLSLLAAGSFPLIYRLLKSYQQSRLQAFLNPYSDPLGSGYHVIQSMIAVGSGKLIGRGLGHGTQSQLRFLPERHSDFIFASLGEELGFVGGSIVLVCYLLLLFRLLQFIKKGTDDLGNQLLIGVFSMIFLQSIINIGMNLGLLPITGITLPLMSSGGSSMISTFASLALAQSVISRNFKIDTIEIR